MRVERGPNRAGLDVVPRRVQPSPVDTDHQSIRFETWQPTINEFVKINLDYFESGISWNASHQLVCACS